MCPYPHPNQAHFLSSNRFMRHGSEGGCSLSGSREEGIGGPAPLRRPVAIRDCTALQTPFPSPLALMRPRVAIR